MLGETWACIFITCKYTHHRPASFLAVCLDDCVEEWDSLADQTVFLQGMLIAQGLCYSAFEPNCVR
jgi:hypothetical protein